MSPSEMLRLSDVFISCSLKTTMDVCDTEELATGQQLDLVFLCGLLKDIEFKEPYLLIIMNFY